MSITQWFQPPLYWQQFEKLTEGVFSCVYGDPRPTPFGRPGQADNGVDVFGRQSGNGPTIGIQCKRMDENDENNEPRPGGKILKKHLNAESKKALKFRSRLDTWILATTAKRDARIQEYTMELDEKSRAKDSFGIQLWFWDDFITDLNRHHELQQWYYKQVIQVRSSDDQDRIILELLGEAFSRAAFRTPLHLEMPDELIQAIKDTQHAISTGELKDRETRRVIRKAIGGRRAITSEPVNDFLVEAEQLLQKLRVEFRENQGKTILQSGGMLQMQPAAQQKLSRLRDDAVAAINKALKHADLKPV